MQIILETIAAFLGVSSVFFSIRKNILVYPIGIVSTGLYSYLLFQWALFGEMLINMYYTIMSFYGWWQWLRGHEGFTNHIALKPSEIGIKLILIGIFSFCVIISIYSFHYGSFSSIPFINYIDSLAAAIFSVAMYLMAHKKIENWLFWILGNILASYLFLTKGYAISALQYVVFLVMALIGWKAWKSHKTLES